VISELCETGGVLLNCVNDPVFIGYPTRPVSGQAMSQGFGLPSSLKGSVLNFLNS
jgi:hypothetical protein